MDVFRWTDHQEVWLYLLNVLSEDKTTEITTIMALASSYQLLPASLPSFITSVILKTALQHHTRRFFNPTYADLISTLTAEPPQLPAKASGSNSHGHGHVHGGHGHAPHGHPHQQHQHQHQQSSTLEIDETLTLRSQYGRFLPPPPTTPPSRQAFLTEVEEVLAKFWHAESDAGRDGEWRRRKTGMEASEKDWVWLVTPFVCCLTRPVAVFLGFQGLMQTMRKSDHEPVCCNESLVAAATRLQPIRSLQLNEPEGFPPIPHRLATFLTLFRRALPELFDYFEDEQVPYVDVAMSWMQTLFSKEMWLENVLRLWGMYLVFLTLRRSSSRIAISRRCAIETL